MKRKFTEQQQKEIYERDKRCLLCGTSTNLSRPHHCYFGNHRINNYEKDYNGIWNGATLCTQGHNSFHHSTKTCNGKTTKENRLFLELFANKNYE